MWQAALAQAVIGSSASITEMAAETKMGKSMENLAKYNAQISENNAKATRRQTLVEAGQVRRQNRLRLSSIRAAYAKAGVDISAADDVMSDIGAQGELERLSTIYSGAMVFNAYKGKATEYRYTATAMRDARRLRQVAGILNTVSGAIGGGSSMMGGGR